MKKEKKKRQGRNLVLLPLRLEISARKCSTLHTMDREMGSRNKVRGMYFVKSISTLQ